MRETILNIGFDDTDSPKGMCTTYLAYKIVDLLKDEKVEFLDFPRLVRFNPNIPWKTRGNGAVGIKIKTNNPKIIKQKIFKMLKRYSDTKNGANPGLVFYEGEVIPESFSKFSKMALWKLIKRGSAKKLLQKHNIDFYYQGNGQGLIGALGAIGYSFDDHTMELLSYRQKSKFGTKRSLSESSVKEMQEKTFPFTFNSYDNKKNHVMIAPRGPDPVFYGIRGEDPDTLIDASKMIKSNEKPQGYMLFKSNQGTGAHLDNELDVNDLRPYDSGTITGIVSRNPVMNLGGHVTFSLKSNNKEITCAIYKPTGITNHGMNLIIGDMIKVGGGIRKASKNYSRVLNVEFLEILELKRLEKKSNPRCNDCNKQMKSKGKSQGFECIRCGKKEKNKVTIEIPRKLEKKKYLPILSAHRHLTRPAQRQRIQNKKSQFKDSRPWFFVFNN